MGNVNKEYNVSQEWRDMDSWPSALFSTMHWRQSHIEKE